MKGLLQTIKFKSIAIGRILFAKRFFIYFEYYRPAKKKHSSFFVRKSLSIAGAAEAANILANAANTGLQTEINLLEVEKLLKNG